MKFFYIEQDMYEAHDALICIGNKSYISDSNRPKYSDQHYLKSDKEMELLFSDIPEALQNNYNLVYKINYRPKFSRPILPNITSNNGSSPDEVLKEESLKGLNKNLKNYLKLVMKNYPPTNFIMSIKIVYFTK